MSFLCPISHRKRFGLDVIWIHVPLVVTERHGPVTLGFLFDTGCQITTVSEDVAETLGLPTGGREVDIRGATAEGRARFVDVRFQFPQTTSGGPGLEVHSTWMVTSGQPSVALLGFQEVHRHFQLKLHEFDAYFIRWPT